MKKKTTANVNKVNKVFSQVEAGETENELFVVCTVYTATDENSGILGTMNLEG